MKRYIFVAKGMLPIIALADSKAAMREYVRDLTGLRSLPRHCIASIAA